MPLGTFDTYKVNCVRYVGGSWADDVTWHYAPEPGVVVRRILSGLPPEDLVAFGPPAKSLPPNVAATAERLRSQILEKTPSDEMAMRTSGGISLTVTPVRSWKTEKGVWCREFRETLRSGDRISMALATACRAGPSRWVAPSDS